MTITGLRVGFVLGGMSGPGSGSWTRFEALVRGLAEAQVEVHVLSPKKTQSALEGMPVIVSTVDCEGHRVSRLLLRQRQVRKFVREKSLSIVHIEAPPFPSLPEVVSIGSIHDLRFFETRLWQLRTPEGLYQRLLLRRQAQNLTRIATLGPWGRSEVHRLLNVPQYRILEVPPIVEPILSTVDKSSAEKQSPPVQGAFALVLGHLEPRKNIVTLLHATTLTAWPKELALVIAGKDAGEGAKLRDIALRSRCNVHFLGPVSEASKWNLLSRAELVLVPSLIEGFGIVGIESTIAGTVALLSDRAALPSIAGDKRAIVSALDTEAWAKTVGAMYSNLESRLSVLSSQVKVAQRYTRATVISHLLQSYEELLAHSR